MVHQFSVKQLRNLASQMWLHEDILLSIDTKLLLEMLHSIWSILVTLKTFLKETVDLHGIPPFKV